MDLSLTITIMGAVLSIGIAWGVSQTIQKKHDAEIVNIHKQIAQIQEETKVACTEVATASKTAMDAMQSLNQEHMSSLERFLDLRFKTLEEKQDKHNNLIERMTIVEQSTKSAHKRLDTVCEKMDTPRRTSRKESI